MLSGACRRVLRSSTSIRYNRKEAIHGPLGAVTRTQRLLSTSSSPEDGTGIAVEPEHLRNIAIIAHVGKCCADCPDNIILVVHGIGGKEFFSTAVVVVFWCKLGLDLIQIGVDARCSHWLSLTLYCLLHSSTM